MFNSFLFVILLSRKNVDRKLVLGRGVLEQVYSLELGLHQWILMRVVLTGSNLVGL